MARGILTAAKLGYDVPAEDVSKAQFKLSLHHGTAVMACQPCEQQLFDVDAWGNPIIPAQWTAKGGRKGTRSQPRGGQKGKGYSKGHSQKGVGLGLSLVNAVLKLHNASIELVEKNSGLRVTLNL